MSYFHKIYKSGGAFVVSIPIQLMRALNLLPGSYVNFTIIDGKKLLITQVPNIANSVEVKNEPPTKE